MSAVRHKSFWYDITIPFSIRPMGNFTIKVILQGSFQRLMVQKETNRKFSSVACSTASSLHDASSFTSEDSLVDPSSICSMMIPVKELLTRQQINDGGIGRDPGKFLQFHELYANVFWQGLGKSNTGVMPPSLQIRLVRIPKLTKEAHNRRTLCLTSSISATSRIKTPMMRDGLLYPQYLV